MAHNYLQPDILRAAAAPGPRKVERSPGTVEMELQRPLAAHALWNDESQMQLLATLQMSHRRERIAPDYAHQFIR
jgi:hypothetical protein